MELYRKQRQYAINTPAKKPFELCYNSTDSGNSSFFSGVRGKRLKRLLLLLTFSVSLLIIPSCGGGGGSSNTPASRVQHRALISNTYSGNLQVVNSQNDTTAYTQQTTNSAGQIVPGVPVTIPAGTSVTFEQVTNDRSKTLVYDQPSNSLVIITNSTEAKAGAIGMYGPATMALFGPDNNTIYVPERSLLFAGQPRLGGVQVLDATQFTNTANYAVPSASSIALSPDGHTLLVFADNSDSVFLINLSATPVSTTEITGFARPVNAFFSSDSTTAYVLNCGWECGSATTQASVAQLTIASQAIAATVPVGGATVGLLNNGTLYVAGTSMSAGPTFDAVNVSTMTRLTATSVPITDGYHSTMALASNNKLYIGASTCLNQTAGCLSVVDVSKNSADPPLPPRGNVTGMHAVVNRNVVYVVEGGYLVIYDTTSDTPQKTQIIFTGALYDVVQVDP